MDVMHPQTATLEASPLLAAIRHRPSTRRSHRRHLPESKDIILA
jgi:hypothetical protein